MFQVPETAGAFMGVPGRFYARSANAADSLTWINQTWVSEARPVMGYGEGAIIRAEIRFDDSCHNGHNTFAITGIITTERRGQTGADVIACGSIHDDIAVAFPELVPLIRWHLTSSDGPMHYVANTVYFAGDRDCNGRRAGDVSQTVDMIRFAEMPLAIRIPRGLLPFLRELEGYEAEGKRAALVPISVPHVDTERRYSTTFAPKWQFAGQKPLKWHECPFDTEEEAHRFAESFVDHSPVIFQMATAWSEGKARDLDGARRVAVWPDATAAELSAEPTELRDALEARLPALLAAFRADIEASGLLWSPADYKGH